MPYAEKYEVPSDGVIYTANRIRAKGVTGDLEWKDGKGFGDAVDAIPTGGGGNLQAKSAYSDGVVFPDEGYDGLSQVAVNVAQTGGVTVISERTDPSSSVGNNNDICVVYNEYGVLKNTGSSYINTGYVPKLNTKIVFKCKYKGGNSSSTFFGSRLRAVTDASAGSVLCLVYNNSFNIAFGTTVTAIPNVTPTVNEIYTIELKSGEYTITRGPDKYSGSLSAVSTLTTYPLYIFVLDQKGSPAASTYSFLDFIYMKIYEDDTLVHYYQPAMNNGIACIYDYVDEEYVMPPSGSTITIQDQGLIVDAKIKVSGAWQDLIGTNVGDVSF